MTLLFLKVIIMFKILWIHVEDNKLLDYYFFELYQYP